MAPSERRIATPGLASLMSLGLLLGIAEPVGSYEPETHREISATAINRSSLDDVLKTQYGVDEGILFAINGENVRTWVEIGAGVSGQSLHVHVLDDGRGLARAASGSGLEGLRDRVETVGGTFTLDSVPGRGTIVSATLPL